MTKDSNLIADGLVILPDKDWKQPTPDKLQNIFENLMISLKSAASLETTYKIEPIIGGGQIIEQELYAERGYKFPLPGIRLRRSPKHSDVTHLFEYSFMVDYYDSEYDYFGYKDIYVAIGMCHFMNPKRGVTSPIEDYGPTGEEILKRFDEPMLQAMANQSKEKILRSVFVERSNSDLNRYLQTKGYQPETNRPNRLYKIYLPR